jgi:hypothetical protein
MYYPRFFTTYPSINGAYTELFAAFSENITTENSGIWGTYRIACRRGMMLTALSGSVGSIHAHAPRPAEGSFARV